MVNRITLPLIVYRFEAWRNPDDDYNWSAFQVTRTTPKFYFVGKPGAQLRLPRQELEEHGWSVRMEQTSHPRMDLEVTVGYFLKRDPELAREFIASVERE